MKRDYGMEAGKQAGRGKSQIMIWALGETMGREEMIETGVSGDKLV